MEEDIKILEEMKFWEGCETTIDEKWCKALENLLTRYKQLEEMLKNRIKYTNELEKDLFENASNYVVPKSKIKEKIEELKKQYEDYSSKWEKSGRNKAHPFYRYLVRIEAEIDILQELLEEE